MKKKYERKYSEDGAWSDYRTPEYYEVLKSTAWAWLSCIEARITAPGTFSEKAATEAYNRTIITLPQLPLEHGGSGIEKRFDRSRWRDVRVCLAPGTRLHGEHPWSKHVTKRLVWENGSSALKRGVKKEDLVGPLTEILDARQDTVLLPHERVSQYGIVSEMKADGLGGRYVPAIESGSIDLIDRSTGAHVTLDEIREIESRIEERVSAAVEKMSK